MAEKKISLGTAIMIGVAAAGTVAAYFKRKELREFADDVTEKLMERLSDLEKAAENVCDEIENELDGDDENVEIVIEVEEPEETEGTEEKIEEEETGE